MDLYLRCLKRFRTIHFRQLSLSFLSFFSIFIPSYFFPLPHLYSVSQASELHFYLSCLPCCLLPVACCLKPKILYLTLFGNCYTIFNKHLSLLVLFLIFAYKIPIVVSLMLTTKLLPSSFFLPPSSFFLLPLNPNICTLY